MNKAGEHWLSFKSTKVSEEGTFEGLLSPYGNVDNGGDIVVKGAYTKTLKDRNHEVPMLWQHNADEPIGMLKLEDREDGLWCKGQLLMDLGKAKEAYICIKAGVVKGLSIGYKAIKDEYENGKRLLKEIKLYEGSVVTFPMNEAARIVAIKMAALEKKDGEFAEELSEIQLYSMYYQLKDAFDGAQREIVWNTDLSKAEKVSASKTIVEDFASAWTKFIPKYIDLVQNYMDQYSDGGIRGKAGASFSAANRQKMQTACDMIKGGHDQLLALFSANEETNEAAGEPAGTLERKEEEPPKPEPVVEDHSKLLSMFDEARF